MAEISRLNSPELIEAVRLWTGWGNSIMPLRDDKALEIHFGKDVAAEILSLIKSLKKDYYSSDAQFVAANLQEMEKLASLNFKRKHPSVAEEIVKVFAWCYTFDFR